VKVWNIMGSLWALSGLGSLIWMPMHPCMHEHGFLVGRSSAGDVCAPSTASLCSSSATRRATAAVLSSVVCQPSIGTSFCAHALACSPRTLACEALPPPQLQRHSNTLRQGEYFCCCYYSCYRYCLLCRSSCSFRP
jgi:hypothetical protein